MRELTAARLRQVLSYDPLTGAFVWLIAPRGHHSGVIAGTTTQAGYIQIKIDGAFYTGHRLAWIYTHGEWPTGEVDHRNGKRNDNSLLNLRDTTRAVNSENIRAAHRDSRSGLLGVSWSKDKELWYSRIRVRGATRFLGYFADPDAAHAAYITEKRVAHEGSTL